MNGKIICTLFKKDLKSCLANKNILISMLIPLFFCLLYRFLFDGLGKGAEAFVLDACAVFAVSIVPTSILPVMIAEEKEKYTLRSLMLARVKGGEFLFSKISLCLLLTLADAAAVYFLSDGRAEHFPLYTVLILISSAGLCFLGAIAGLMAKDQAAAGTLSAPLTLLSMLPPLFAGLNETVGMIAVIFPTTSYQTIFHSAAAGNRLFTDNNLTALAVCAVWIIGGAVLFNLFYQKKGVDC